MSRDWQEGSLLRDAIRQVGRQEFASAHRHSRGRLFAARIDLSTLDGHVAGPIDVDSYRKPAGA